MSYRTDDDDTSARIGALRVELGHRLVQLAQLDREHARLTSEKRRRPPVFPEQNAVTDDDRIALLNHALDQLQTEILAQRRENEALRRSQFEQARDKPSKSWLKLFRFLLHLGHKL